MFTSDCLIINRNSPITGTQVAIKMKEKEKEQHSGNQSANKFPSDQRQQREGFPFLSFFFLKAGKGDVWKQIMGLILFNAINWPISHMQLPGTHDISLPSPAWRGAVINVSGGLKTGSQTLRD